MKMQNSKLQSKLSRYLFLTGFMVEDGRVVNNIMAINRFIVLAASLLFIYLTWSLNIIRFNPLVAVFFVMPAIAAANGIWLWYYRAHRPGRFYFLLQVLTDTGLVLAVVYYTGGLYSDFLFLPLIILSLAALVSWRLSFAAFALASGFYLYLFFYQMTGMPIKEIFQSFGGLNGMKLIRILIFVFMGVLTGFTISYFVALVKRKNEEMEKIKREKCVKTVRVLSDSLTAIRWILDMLDDREFLSRNLELAKGIEALRQFKEKILATVKKSLVVADNDFSPEEDYKNKN